MIRRLAIILSLAFVSCVVCSIALAQPFTTITAKGSPSPSTFGQPIIFSATVTVEVIGIAQAKPAPPAAAPTGTVTFTNSTSPIPLGTATLDVNGNAVLAPLTLPAGGYKIIATYNPDSASGLDSSMVTFAQVVTQAKPNITWVPNPATIAAGAPLTAAQLDATASTQFTPNVPGTFTYTPPAGTTFPEPGRQGLRLSFTPTDTANFTATTGNTSIDVVSFTLTSINPNTATLGDKDKKVTLTGTGFSPNSVVEVNGNPLMPTNFVNATTLTASIPAIAFATVSTLQLTVFDSQLQFTTNALPLPVTVPPLQIVLTGPATSPPATQSSLDFRLGNPFPAPLSGVFTLTFTPAAGLTDDPMIKFINGSRTLTFTIPANSTTTPSVQLQSGTVAGTIAITLSVTAGGVDVTPDGLQPVIIQLPPAPPMITSTTLQRNGQQLTLVIHGYSNTRELTTANFDFTAARGSIKNPDISVPVSTLFTQWYSSQPSDQFGSTFTYTQNFTLNDDASHIGSVSVTLVNSIGTSTPGSAQ